MSKLHQMAADAGRETMPTVAFTPPSLLMTGPGNALPSPEALIDEAGQLADAGVTQLTISLPGETRKDLLAAMDQYAANVIPKL